MKQQVVVTGLGAVTPLGNDVPTTWEALVAGRSGVDRISVGALTHSAVCLDIGLDWHTGGAVS